MRRSRLLSCLLPATALLLAAAPGLASSPAYYEDGRLFFLANPGVAVSHNTVRAPEGPVEVIMVRAVDPVSGEPTSGTFVALTVFAAALDGEASPLDIVVNGVRHTADGASVTTSPTTLQAFGRALPATQLGMDWGGAGAVARAAAIELPGGGTVVVYEHRDLTSAADTSAIDAVLATSGFGPAPELPPPAQTAAPTQAAPPTADDHAGHAPADDHAGHNHAPADDHAGHAPAPADDHAGHNHAPADDHAGHGH